MTYHSTLPPPIVFPDEPLAHDTAIRLIGNDCDYEFCRDYKRDAHITYSNGGTVWRNRCANRRFEGDRTKSWCHRCVAGFMSLDSKESAAFDKHGTHTDAIRL